MGEGFHECCRYMFYTSLLMILLMIQALNSERNWFKWIVNQIVYFLVLMQFVIVIYGFYLRLSHNGRVCCGDFLSPSDSKEGYLILMGQFWKYIMMLWTTGWCLLCLCVFFTLKKDVKPTPAEVKF